MRKKVIEIDEARCIGCGLCANTCHQSAIAVIDGKAKVIRADFCDGLGRCLAGCPVDALHIVEREVADAIMANKSVSCPSTQAQTLTSVAEIDMNTPTMLRNWPVQLQLAPLQAPYYQGAHLLIAADCAAYAVGDFHSRYMAEKVTLIACPKLGSADYVTKLTQILQNNEVQSITVARMEVPCCGGLAHAVQQAVSACGKDIPLQVDILKLPR